LWWADPIRSPLSEEGGRARTAWRAWPPTLDMGPTVSPANRQSLKHKNERRKCAPKN
jgi:hypothetical protein